MTPRSTRTISQACGEALMGWNSEWDSLAVVAQEVSVQGGNDGLFVYNGAPTTGNLVGSITSAAGADPYGNGF
jgi:hypothetical protein